jgi:hypothetical protein
MFHVERYLFCRIPPRLDAGSLVLPDNPASQEARRGGRLDASEERGDAPAAEVGDAL